MKIFISADIEGTCGITSWMETERSTPKDYDPFQQQMTREVAAAVLGAQAGGATEVLVRDAHDSARNLDATLLPTGIHMLRGWTGDLLSMMSGVDKGGYDAVFFTGYHAWAASSGNPLAHTMNLQNEYVTLNGVRMSEFMMNTYTAWYYNTPVTFLSGDRTLCDVAKALIPNMITVPVNEGWGGGVYSIHPQAALVAIQEGTRLAAGLGSKCPPQLPKTFETTIRFHKHTIAYSKQFYPGAWLEDEKNVCFRSDDWLEVLRFYHFVLNDA